MRIVQEDRIRIEKQIREIQDLEGLSDTQQGCMTGMRNCIKLLDAYAVGLQPDSNDTIYEELVNKIRLQELTELNEAITEMSVDLYFCFMENNKIQELIKKEKKGK